MVRWRQRPFFCLLLLLLGCRPVEVPEGVLTAVSAQLSPSAIVLLPVAASQPGLETVDLSQVDELLLRDLLRGERPVYLLFDPDDLGAYGETAVGNIEWVQNHSQPVELTRHEQHWVLYWIVVPNENVFEPPGLLVAPGG